jgi:muramoyltetrapeptide carboxypeptidase
MQRKHFLGTIATLFSGSLLPAKAAISEPFDAEPKILLPPYLKPGAVIGISSPAGTITAEELKPAIEQIKSWGFRPAHWQQHRQKGLYHGWHRCRATGRPAGDAG